MFIPWVEQEIYDQISFENVKEVRWNAYAVDCFHKECGKKHGITDVLNYYGISKEDSCSVGDGENDIIAGNAAGCRSVLIANKQENTIDKGIAADVVNDVVEFVDKYISNI